MKKTILSDARKNSGQQIIEMAAGLLVLIPVIMGLIDIAVVLIGVNVNDTVCRDAARAAAQGNPLASPGSGSYSMDRAQAVVTQRDNQKGGYIAKIQLLTTGSDGSSVNAGTPLPDPTFGGAFTGSVSIVTQTTVKIPAYIPGVVPNQIDLKAKQVFPITYQQPAK